MPIPDILRCLTAFTHPRRLTVLSLFLRNRSLAFCEIAGKSRISQPALDRHLDKLRRRGLVVPDENDRWTLLPPPPLAAVFLELLKPYDG